MSNIVLNLSDSAKRNEVPSAGPTGLVDYVGLRPLR